MGHSGILYGNSFVMYDTATGSLWVHATGRAESGPHRGRQLEVIPSTVTSWRNWKRANPHTLVLDGRRAGSFMGVFEGFTNRDSIGLAVIIKFEAVLFTFASLHRTPVRNVRFGDVALLLVFDRSRQLATVWRRSVGERTLTFRPTLEDGPQSPIAEDRETGSQWDVLRGVALSGPLEGMSLDAVSNHPMLIERFKAFYPEAPVHD